MQIVSVVITTYQRPLDLAHCLRAIQLQQGDGFHIEVCVVNDGGVPIAPVVRLFPEMYIKFVDSPRNLGQVAARNLALTLATGSYVALCDDDDRWLPGHIQALLHALAADREAVLAYTDTELVTLNRSGGTLAVEERKVFAWRQADRLLSRYNPIAPSSVLYRRELHERIGRFDVEMAHYWDWDFFLRSKAAGNIARVAACETLYGIDAGGGNQSADPEHMRPYLMRLIHKHRLGELPSSNFGRMLEDDALQCFRAESTLVWNGQPGIWLDSDLTAKVNKVFGHRECKG